MPPNSPLRALVTHQELAWLKQSADFKLWQRSGIVRFSDLFTQGHFVPFGYLSAKVRELVTFKVVRLSAINNLLNKQLSRVYLTSFEKLLSSGAVFKKSLPKIY